ncbi:MAG TPA: AI-2E family transporter [Gemmatimonadaceae bacterium]
MSQPDIRNKAQQRETPPQRDDLALRRRPGWGSAAILRTATLVIGIYLGVQLVWFAHYLFLVAFLGILFGLAIAAGVDKLQKWGLPRGLGAAAIVIAFFGLLVGFGAWMAPTLQEQSVELRRRLPQAIDRVEAWMNSHRTGFIGLIVNSFASNHRDTTTAARPAPPATPAAPTTAVPTAPQQQPTDSISLPATLRERVGAGFSNLTSFLFPFLSSTLEVIAGFLIVVFLSIYIAADPEMYRRGIMHLVPLDRRERAGEVLSAIAAVLRKWLVTQLIAMLVIGTVSTIVLALLGVKASFALGVLAGLLEFVPTIGPIMSAIPAVAMGFIDSPEKALWVLIAYWGIQFFENHLLIPMLMKGGINLPPALTILSQALMAMVFGFLGLMCAVPLLAAAMVGVRMLYVEGAVGEQHLPPTAEVSQVSTH